MPVSKLLGNILAALALSFPAPISAPKALSPRWEQAVEVPQVVSVGGFCSGFVAAEGLVVTAAHCVAGAVAVKQLELPLRFSDGFRSNFFILGYGDEDSRDWALLVGDTHGVEPLKIASEPPPAGTTCVDIGYGGGSPVQHLTPCSVRGVEDGYLLLAANIIPGDSGSPVVNPETGEVFGIAVRSAYPVPVGLAVDVRRAISAGRRLLRARHVAQPR